MTGRNKSEWGVGCVSCAAKTFYQVYRLIDPEGPNWKGNRETRGGYYESVLDAERLRDLLNEEEDEKWDRK